MSSPSIYLISGANPGIGVNKYYNLSVCTSILLLSPGFVKQLVAHKNVIVQFAGAWNPSGTNDLHALVQKYPGKLYINVKHVSRDKATNDAAAVDHQGFRQAGRRDCQCRYEYSFWCAMPSMFSMNLIPQLLMTSYTRLGNFCRANAQWLQCRSRVYLCYFNFIYKVYYQVHVVGLHLSYFKQDIRCLRRAHILNLSRFRVQGALK